MYPGDPSKPRRVLRWILALNGIWIKEEPSEDENRTAKYLIQKTDDGSNSSYPVTKVPSVVLLVRIHFFRVTKNIPSSRPHFRFSAQQTSDGISIYSNGSTLLNHIIGEEGDEG